MDRKEIKLLAKKRLSENRWPMVLVSLIIVVAGAIVTSQSGINFSTEGAAGTEIATAAYQQTNKVIICLAWLLSIFVVNIIKIGGCGFFRKNITSNEQVARIGDGFKTNYIKNVLTMVVVAVLTAIGFCLLIVPGFIVALGFALVPYILISNPELSLKETLALSWNLMKGHKWEYFVLGLSFFGWFFLDFFTLGILGIFYVHPYFDQTQAIFCDKLLNQEVPQQAENA